MEHFSDWVNIKIGIGRAIKMKRVLSGLTYQQLAQQSQLSQEILQAYETGKKDIPLEHLYRISYVLEVDMSALIPDSFY